MRRWWRCSDRHRLRIRRPRRRRPASRRSTSNAVRASSASVRWVISVACASCRPSWSTIWRAKPQQRVFPSFLADTMPTARTPPIYTSPQDAAQAFYQAFEARDLDAMMATWAEDEDIVCIHPGGTRHVGYEAVRAGFEQLFSGRTKLTFRLDQVVLIE